MDVLPTFMDILSMPAGDRIDGCSLLQPQADRFVVLEDHSVFAPDIGVIHDLWGIRTQEHLYLENLSGQQVLLTQTSGGQYNIVENPDPALIEQLQARIARYACSYASRITT